MQAEVGVVSGLSYHTVCRIRASSINRCTSVWCYDDRCLLCRRVSPWKEWRSLWELFQPWLSNQLHKQEEMYLGYHSTRWLSHTGCISWFPNAEKFRCFENLRWRFQFKRCAGDLEWWFVELHLRLQWIFFMVRVHIGREYHCKRFPRNLHNRSEYVSSYSCAQLSQIFANPVIQTRESVLINWHNWFIHISVPSFTHSCTFRSNHMSVHILFVTYLYKKTLSHAHCSFCVII